MNRRSLLLGLAACACGSRSQGSAFAEAALSVARRAGQSTIEESSSRNELARLADVLRVELNRAPERSVASVFGEVLFERLGFAREVVDTSLRYVLLPSVLRARRGNCVGLGTLTIALAEMLGRSAQGVLMPGHFYIRFSERGGPRNLELLRRGEAMSDAWYAARFPIPGGSAPEYARPLSSREVQGVIEYDVGNERRRQLRLEEARTAYTRAVALFPQLSEAHASLAATLQLLGRFQESAASYARARAVNPNLPGLEWNRALLDEERGVATAR